MLLVALYVLLPATTIMVRVADSIFGHWGGVGVKMYPSVSFRFLFSFCDSCDISWPPV